MVSPPPAPAPGRVPGETDSVLAPDRSFVLATDSMDQRTLKRYGLRRGDAIEASDHYPVIVDFQLRPAAR